MKKTLLAIVALSLVLILFIVAFNSNKSVQDDNRIKVVTTTTQLHDFTKNIAGDLVQLSTVFEADVDPHEYEATPSDIVNISNADLIIYNGLGLEGSLIKSISESQSDSLNASEGISDLLEGDDNHEDESTEEEDHSDEEKSLDPHIWFSVANVKIISEMIADKLQTLDPQNASLYEKNLQSYLTQLDNLDLEIRTQIESIPENNRKLVTNHDAFGYYIDAYKLEYVGSIIPSLSTEEQPTSSETSELISKINEQGVKAIFTESSINPKLANQIAQETGAKVVSTLYGDTLGEPGSAGDTYIKMMEYNTIEIVKGLK